jgi:hypothetical protein
VTTLKFDVQILSSSEPLLPPFLPLMQNATVSFPAVEHLLGSVGGGVGGGAPPTRMLELLDDYKRLGFQPGDKKQLFAKLTPPMPGLSVPTERAGGLAAPKFKPFDGLSRARGLVSDVSGFAADHPISPDDLIGDTKLLGSIFLKQIVDSDPDNVPVDDPAKLFNTIDNPGVFATRPVMTTVQAAGNTEVRFIWKPRIKPAGLPFPLTNRGGMALIVKGRVTKSGEPRADAAFQVHGQLTNFGLAFGNLLTVNFNGVTFESGGGRKMSFKADIKDVEFGSELAFVEKMTQLLPTNDLGAAPAIQPQPDGVTIRFAAAIPSFSLGGMSLQNIAITTSISLPFVDKPAAVRFSLSERDHPFLVSVAIFGGTGFFALEVRTDGTVQLEAAIEFGGIVSLDLLGIVRGGVYLFAGVYVSLDSGQHIVSGHLRFGGYVDVAGLISVSIEFYIELRQQDTILVGEGSVTINVRILFFSLSQTFTVSKTIAGFGEAPSIALGATAGGSPDFTSTMNPFQWEKYCRAFN